MGEAWRAQLAQDAETWGLTLNETQLQQFVLYRRLLQTWNRRLNLTAVDDDEGIRVRHFLDSLSCATATGDLNGQRLIDVGTGAGFPGLPLKILYPYLHLTLVESVTKKTRFLQAVVEELGLQEVAIIDRRAETVGQQPAHREQYDWAVARAVAALPVLAEYLLPLCRLGGHALAMKGETAPEEVAQATDAVATFGGGAPTLHPVQLPGQPETYYLVLIEKVASTPHKYPRRPGMPAKRPIGE
ncbi:MAG TPA: 16S rRNA (guanine(527)-N(7))-methyltransferase RsmG [Candidatus Sulfomarinibacteraceae bacterium]|nr:16S rRNA (guanine(527)-N(7))-methyltransferase RsmG [Candidatus Sulfomarinibacteraceae bacterium]